MSSICVPQGPKARGFGPATLIVVIVLTAIEPAQAQPADVDRARAVELQVEGVRLFERGQVAVALARFQEAYALVPSPKVLFNLARAHEALGDEVHALRAIEQFLDEGVAPPAARRAEALAMARRLQAKLGRLEIACETTGAEVAVDGENIGRTPLPRPVAVAPGPRLVRVMLEGSTPFEARVSPLAGQKLRVLATLSPPVVEEPPDDPPRLEVAMPAVTLSRSPAVETLAEKSGGEPPSRPNWRRSAAWISAGTAVVMLGTAVTAQVMASSKYREFNHLKGPGGSLQCGRTEPEYGGGACPALLRSADRRLGVAVVGYVAGGAAAALAGTFFVFSRRSPESATLACAPQAGAWGISCVRSF